MCIVHGSSDALSGLFYYAKLFKFSKEYLLEAEVLLLLSFRTVECVFLEFFILGNALGVLFDLPLEAAQVALLLDNIQHIFDILLLLYLLVKLLLSLGQVNLDLA